MTIQAPGPVPSNRPPQVAVPPEPAIDGWWQLCCECGFITPGGSWLALNYNDAYQEAPYEPELIPAKSDPSICRCPACGHDHRDDDSGAGFCDGTREEMIAERDRLEAEGWSW